MGLSTVDTGGPSMTFSIISYASIDEGVTDCTLVTPSNLIVPPLRSTVVRASVRGAGGRGSIDDRVIPKT